MCISIYSWPLNNTSLNCKGPLICRYFSIVNTTVLRNPLAVESKDVTSDTEAPRYRGPTINYMWILNYAEGRCPDPHDSGVNCIIYFIYLHMIYDIYKPHTLMTSLRVSYFSFHNNSHAVALWGRPSQANFRSLSSESAIFFVVFMYVLTI